MGILLHCWECKPVQPFCKTGWRFLKKLKIELPYNPAIALLGIYPKDAGVLMHRGTCTPTFIAALSTIAKLWKEPIDQRTDIEDVLYIHNGKLLGDEKECNLAICNSVDGTGGYYAN